MNKNSARYIAQLAAKNGTTIEAACARLNEQTAEQCKGRYTSAQVERSFDATFAERPEDVNQNSVTERLNRFGRGANYRNW